MGRPPCCDKVGIKKGPWTPEEDIILVSYIQEHGPGNWRSVPTNTGLSRCSKSCRLRWTNYLRPGIKRGNFTPHEEGMIIHLQALLGNKWAAIASYLPQRTDNDIKNYWNTHLKKKLKKLQVALDPHLASDSTTTGQFPSKSFNDTKSLDIITTTTTTSSINNHHHASSLRPSQSQSQTQSSPTTYASSTENISRLLEGWMRTSPKPLKETQLQERFHQSINDGERGFKSGSASATAVADASDEFENSNNNNNNKLVKSASMPAALNLHHHQHKTKDEHNEGGEMVSHEEFDSILSFENLNSSAWDKSTCDSMPENKAHHHHHQGDHNINMAEKNNANAPPLSFLEKWLLDENVGHVEEMMELSPMF